MQAFKGPSCKANKVQHIKVDNADVNETNSNMPYFSLPRINGAADRRVSQVLTDQIHYELSDVFQGSDVLKACIFYRLRMIASHMKCSLGG